jgi:hypothetical protein
MKRLLLGLGALALTLTTAGAAKAADHHRGREVVRREMHRAPRYYELHGVRFSGGYYYRGFEQARWGPRVWNAGLHRWECWDADLRCNYYWCPERGCWYPVTYVVPCP